MHFACRLGNSDNYILNHLVQKGEIINEKNRRN